MKLFQPKPNHSCPVTVASDAKISAPVPVYLVRYRYAHHAGPSGYDRVCDFLNAEQVALSDSLYWLGETLLRPPALWFAKTCGIFEYSRYDWIMEQAVIRHAHRNQPGVYHFVYGEKSFARSGEALAKNGHRVVLTMHHPEAHLEQYFRDFTHLQHVSCILTMDHDMVPVWNKHAGREIARWVPHGVDCDYFTPIEKGVSDEKTIVFAGTHERDIDTLLRTIEQLSIDESLRFRLLSKNPKLKALGEKHKRVETIDWVDDPAYLEFIQNADLLLLPLKMSTVCNVVLEAMACGVPVVTTVGGIGAYLDHDSGLMVEAEDIAGWCDAVNKLLGDADAPRRARAHSLRFHWGQIAKTQSEIFREVMK
ncbi:glycosyltransferase family 4 protein [Coraliomargarita algicola]|uniref:Glycosyltransferase family 4 protein n=1 Tax=Coraliomargarita algicola TaxID=3092156 RepID=A0ABZ0RIU8_9BACT|nr:glycosyltransferase family 4 protein [Coraliomargarita sp. J2-16]WPJ95003.1 glycosyltransferase family 4 protein [Coraliomargarita sp. J2-16]